MKKRGDAALTLPLELGRPGPVAAKADLRVALPRIDVPASTSRYIGVPCETLEAEDLAAGVGVRVEVDQARPGRACAASAVDARLGDRVVAAEGDRHDARLGDLADEPLDRRV